MNAHQQQDQAKIKILTMFKKMKNGYNQSAYLFIKGLPKIPITIFVFCKSTFKN